MHEFTWCEIRLRPETAPHIKGGLPDTLPPRHNSDSPSHLSPSSPRLADSLDAAVTRPARSPAGLAANRHNQLLCQAAPLPSTSASGLLALHSPFSYPYQQALTLPPPAEAVLLAFTQPARPLPFALPQFAPPAAANHQPTYRRLYPPSMPSSAPPALHSSFSYPYHQHLQVSAPSPSASPNATASHIALLQSPVCPPATRPVCNQPTYRRLYPPSPLPSDLPRLHMPHSYPYHQHFQAPRPSSAVPPNANSSHITLSQPRHCPHPPTRFSHILDITPASSGWFARRPSAHFSA